MNLRFLALKESTQTQILLSRRFRRGMAPEGGNPVENPANCEKFVPSLALVFDLELGLTWKDLVVPSVKIVKADRHSNADADTSPSALITMWYSSLSRAARRERLVKTLTWLNTLLNVLRLA
jgi:hypothetical protein